MSQQHQMAQEKRQFNLSKAQAKFRREPWELSLDDYRIIWQDYWHLKGRLGDEYALTRIDINKSWNINNIKVLTRKELNVLIHSRKS